MVKWLNTSSEARSINIVYTGLALMTEFHVLLMNASLGYDNYRATVRAGCHSIWQAESGWLVK